jgi:diguanylate cyclase (GGDEF)-like protein
MSDKALRALWLLLDGATSPPPASGTEVGWTAVAGLQALGDALRSSKPDLAVAVVPEGYSGTGLMRSLDSLRSALASPDPGSVSLPLLVSCASPDVTLAVRLAEWGVQDVLGPQDLQSEALGRRLAMAVVRHQREQEARKAWSTDLDTGLPRREQLMEHLHQLLALRVRQPAPMALVVVAVDGLDAVQRQHGAEAVHVLRRKLAVRLRAAVRASDVVASLGDEGFALLLASIEAAEHGQTVADKLARVAREPIRVLGEAIRLQPAVGAVAIPREGADGPALLQQALQAARLARLGRGGAANDAGQGED